MTERKFTRLPQGDGPVVSDAEHIQEEAMEALDTLRSSTFFKKINNKMRDQLINTAANEEEKKNVFNMFQGAEAEEEVKKDSADLTLEQIQRGRHPILNCVLTTSFHIIMLTNFFSSLFESYEILRTSARTQAQFIAGNFNCLDHIPSGLELAHMINIFQGGFSVVMLFTRRKKHAAIFLAFVFVQILHITMEFSMIIYRLRLTTVSIFRWQHSMTLSIIREMFSLFLILVGVLLAKQRYYDLAQPVAERRRRKIAQSFGKRFLNDQIIYRNAPSFLQRKYALRKATAFQIYSVLRSIKEEASTRHKRGQTLKFDPVFTKQHVFKAKTVIENITEEEIMQLIEA